MTDLIAADVSQTTYKPIDGFDGYRAGSDGTIWSCLKRQGSVAFTVSTEWRQIRPVLGTQKYLAVRLRKSDGMLCTKRVHVLVAAAFHGPCPDGQEVRHKNGNRLDNSSDNLCYGTRKDNMQDSVLHGTSPIGERNPRAKLTASDVQHMRALARDGTPVPELIRMFGVSRSNVYAILNRSLWPSVPEVA